MYSAVFNLNIIIIVWVISELEAHKKKLQTKKNTLIGQVIHNIKFGIKKKYLHCKDILNQTEADEMILTMMDIKLAFCGFFRMKIQASVRRPRRSPGYDPWIIQGQKNVNSRN